MNHDERIEKLLEGVLKFTRLDFSQKLSITAEGDEIDAISAAVNALVEELQASQEGQKRVEEELRRVNHELEAFSYSVSHDLRAPLRAVSGYAGIIEEEYGKALDGEGRRLLHVVRENAHKMGQLIDDLLAFSRLGKKEVQKTRLDMKLIAAAALSELNKTTSSRVNVKIGELHPVFADSALISQVVDNLLSNAVKYSSKKDNPLVEITSEKRGEFIFYIFRDNGVGFDMRYAHKLFGVFQRLHSQEDFEGTGVGLAIVQRIVLRHGGEVGADAKPDEGAAFWFSLPDTGQ